MSAILSKIFGGKPKEELEMSILFHKEALDHVPHGSVYVDSKEHNYTNEPINFVFLDVTTPPRMNATLMKFIEDKAAQKGYKVNELRSYATVMQLQPAPRLSPNQPKSPEQREIERNKGRENRQPVKVHTRPVAALPKPGAPANQTLPPKPQARVVREDVGTHFSNPNRAVG